MNDAMAKPIITNLNTAIGFILGNIPINNIIGRQR